MSNTGIDLRMGKYVIVTTRNRREYNMRLNKVTGIRS